MMGDTLPWWYRLYPVGPPNPYQFMRRVLGNKYSRPHQGEQEIARRKRQRDRGILR